MKPLTTTKQIITALLKLGDDQVENIHHMAASRFLDIETLDIEDYKDLIKEEAEYSFDCGDKSQDDLKYSLELFSIALRIQDPQE